MKIVRGLDLVKISGREFGVFALIWHGSNLSLVGYERWADEGRNVGWSVMIQILEGTEGCKNEWS